MSEFEPVACTLTTKEAAKQVTEWSDVAAVAIERSAIPNGMAVVFPASLAATIDDLAAREATCCSFLSLTTTIVDAGVRLEVTSANPDAQPVIELLVGGNKP